MKNHRYLFTHSYTILFIAVVLFGSVGCKQSETKVEAKIEPTELPVNSTSSEAIAAFNKGMEFLDVGNTQQARVHFSKAIELDSNFASAYIFRSGTSPSNEHFRSDLRSATSKKSSENESEKILIDIYTTYLNNNTEERLRQSQQLVSTYPTSARALVVLGDAYSDISEQAKSREQYQKAIELDPNWVGGYFSLGTSYMNAEPKDFKKAEENFVKVVALKPELSGSHVYLGDAYRARSEEHTSELQSQ